MTTILTLQLQPLHEKNEAFQSFYGKNESLKELIKFLRQYEVKVVKNSFQFHNHPKLCLILRASVSRPGIIESVIEVLKERPRIYNSPDLKLIEIASEFKTPSKALTVCESTLDLRQNDGKIIKSLSCQTINLLNEKLNKRFDEKNLENTDSGTSNPSILDNEFLEPVKHEYYIEFYNIYENRESDFRKNFSGKLIWDFLRSQQILPKCAHKKAETVERVEDNVRLKGVRLAIDENTIVSKSRSKKLHSSKTIEAHLKRSKLHLRNLNNILFGVPVKVCYFRDNCAMFEDIIPIEKRILKTTSTQTELIQSTDLSSVIEAYQSTVDEELQKFYDIHISLTEALKKSVNENT